MSQPKNSKKKIDFLGIIFSFFKSGNWYINALLFGGSIFFLMVLGFISIIPWAMEIEFGFWLTLILLFFVLVVGIILRIVFNSYVFEVYNSFKSGKKGQNIPLFTFDFERLSSGARILLSNIIIALPTIVVYILGYGMVFYAIYMMDKTYVSGSSNTIALVLLILGIVFILIYMALAFLTNTFVSPTIIISEEKYGNLKDILSPRKIFELVKSNILVILLTWAASIIIMIMSFIPIMITMALIYLLIGIVLYPIVLSTISLWVGYTKAAMLAQEGK